VAGDVADALSLDRVIWVPAGVPPHKPGGAEAPTSLRLAMVEAAVEGHPRFEVSALETERPGPSYTVDTLSALRARHRDCDLVLILGEDQYRAFSSWRAPAQIRRLAHLAVMDREGRSGRHGSDDLAPEAGVTFVAVGRVDISSSAVREAIRDGRDVSALLPAGVAEIVDSAGLYRP